MNFRPKTRFIPLILLLALAGSPASSQLLSLVEREVAGTLGDDRSIGITPDGNVVLVSAQGGDAINSYLRDAGTGEVTFADSAVDGQGGVTRLNMAAAAAASPDSANVYVVARQDDAVVTFSLDTVTGDLTLRQELINDVVDGLWFSRGVAVSTDGAYVVTSGRTDPAAPKGSIVLFTRDAGNNGILTFAHVLKNTQGGLTALGQHGGHPTFSPDGAHLYVAAEAGNAVILLTIDTGTDTMSVVQEVVNGQGGVTGIGGPVGMAFSADGTDVYVAGSTSNSVAHFSRNTTTGNLTFVASFADGVGGVDGLGGASSVVVNAEGDRVYVLGPADSAVAVFARSASGDLLYIGFVQDGVDGLDGLGGAYDVALSGDGDYLYVAAAGEDAIGVFERGTGGGGGGGDAADFGDAPDPTYPTLLASDGARHTITDGTLRLGALIDAEFEGAQDAAAAGDDVSVLDDEDGVAFVDALNLGQPADIEVTASAAGLLDAWIDWNDDGDWTDTGERIANGLAVVAGVNTVGVTVPLNAPGGGDVVSRFRLSTAGVAGPTGLAADGEVEDYLTGVGDASDLEIEGDDTISDWTDPYTMTITVTNNGPSPVTGASVTITLSANANSPTWSCVPTNGTCGAGGVGDVNDTVDLASGGTVVYTFNGTVPVDEPGPFIVATGTVSGSTFDPIPANNSGDASVLINSIFLDGFESGDRSAWSTYFPFP